MKMLSSVLSILLQTWATIGVAIKRLLTQRFLSIAAIVGLIVASGFILSVPLYADAIYFRLFREELFSGNEAKLANHPVDYAPMAFTFNLNVAGNKSPQWSDVVKVDQYLTGNASRTIQFPIEQTVRRFRTDGYYMYPPLDPTIPGSKYFLASVNLAFITPLEKTVRLISGQYPQPYTSILELGEVPAIVSETLANTIGVQAGDVYYLRQNKLEIPVIIFGIWSPEDPSAPYWGIGSENWLLVDEASYTSAISDAVKDELRDSIWYIVADGSNLHSGDIAGLNQRIQVIQEQTNMLQEGVNLISSPLDALNRYQKNAPYLTYLLYAFSVPILGLILAFIGLVTGLFVGQQRFEMAIFRSRGASTLQVVGMSMLQGILLGAVALTGGVFLGYWITHAIGQARSFMVFTSTGGLRVSITISALIYGVIGIGIILLIQVLIPTLGSAGNTIITYKQERARLLHKPWWQRYWFDILLLIPAGYGLWQLKRESSLALSGNANIPQPLQNPLLLIAPAIGIFAVALFLLRIVPRFMSLLSWAIRKTKSVGMLMAARYLARTPAFYSAPLVLLLLTLGLSSFTASLAKTLDTQLTKQTYYQIGSDMNVYEEGTTVNSETQTPVFTFGPVEEHLNLKGVLAATRVGRYTATAITSTAAMIGGTFLGVDRTTFPGTAYWQSDFASQPLASLMNALGADPEGVLVPNDVLQKQSLKIGDKLTLGVQMGISGISIPMVLTIVGGFDLFPTWYPDEGPIFVANLDSLYLQAGAEYPHEVWLRTTGNADPEGIVYGIRGYSIMLDQQADQSRLVENGLNTQVTNWSSASDDILAAQRRPERQGLFGLLSVGFVASAILTVLGFMLYALFSFRRRFIEMGMLRAIGLSVKQMTLFLAAELGSLILLGIGAGTLVGVFASILFVPFLKIGSTSQANYPPFHIEIAWLSISQIYGLFIILFVVALGLLSTILQRMKIFQAIKLGESN
jgi:putative ABC transport system permease protein